MSDQYTISGTEADQATSGAAVNPFGTVVVTNTDDEAYGTATVTLTNPANGTLSNLGIGTLSGGGTTYTVSASPAAIQAALNGLVFTPTANEAPPGTPVTTDFGLSVADANGGAATNDTTSVVATALAPSPTITFATRGPASSPLLQPFTNTTIADPNAGALDTTSISLTVGGAASDANGTLSGAGLTKTGVGAYTLAAATPAAETTALQNLVFTPTDPAAGSQTGVTLTVADGVAAPATAAYQDGSTGSGTGTGVPPDTAGYLTIAHPGGGSVTTNTETSQYTYNDTPVSDADHNYSTTIDAVLDGSQVVYEKTFDLPYSDPTVQAAVMQAQTTLENDGATAGPAVETASNMTTQGSTTSTVQTGESTPVETTAVTETFGPAYVGPGTSYALNANADRGFASIVPGQTDINVTTNYQYNIDQTITTTTTDLLSQQYTIAGTSVVCFAAGTRIRTARGDVAVDTLAVGDRVVTASGETRPIRWLGHRTIDCRTHPRPHEARPVRIAAHAFGSARPARDLVVSPGHAICLDVGGEVLIPASALVNGTTIVQLDVEAVTYWHVELDSHDILLAENMPAESYLEMGNRAFFAEAEAVALHAAPDAQVATHADFCRPYVDSGPQLEAARAMLRERQARAKTPRKVNAAA